MNKKLPGGRLRTVLTVLGFCMLIGVLLSYATQTSSAHDFMSSDLADTGGSDAKTGADGETGTL